MRDLGAAIHLRQDAVEAELLLQSHEPVGYLLGCADDNLVAQRLVVSDGLQPAAARGAVLDRAHAGAGRRVLEPLAEIAIEVHDAFFRLGAGLRRRLGDIDRRPQEHFARTRMPSLFPALAVGLDVRGELGKGAEADSDKNTVSELAYGRKGIGAVGGDADLRPRFLIGLGRRPDILERVVLARIGERVLGPRLLQYLAALGETLATLA